MKPQGSVELSASKESNDTSFKKNGLTVQRLWAETHLQLWPLGDASVIVNKKLVDNNDTVPNQCAKFKKTSHQSVLWAA